jgi:hypothetical protein
MGSTMCYPFFCHKFQKKVQTNHVSF